MVAVRSFHAWLSVGHLGEHGTKGMESLPLGCPWLRERQCAHCAEVQHKQRAGLRTAKEARSAGEGGVSDQASGSIWISCVTCWTCCGIQFLSFFFFFPVKMVFQAAVGSDVSHLGFSVLIIMEADKSPDGQGVSASWRQGG